MSSSVLSGEVTRGIEIVRVTRPRSVTNTVMSCLSRKRGIEIVHARHPSDLVWSPTNRGHNFYATSTFSNEKVIFYYARE